jgi:hypothetical protein
MPKPKKMINFFLAAFSFISSCEQRIASNYCNEMQSGYYSGIGKIVLLSDSCTISGYYFNSRADIKSTYFLFKGERIIDYSGLKYQIWTFYPGSRDTIAGSLIFHSLDTVEVELTRVPPGGEFGFDGQTEEMTIRAQKKWLYFGFIDYDVVTVFATEKSNMAKDSLGRYDFFSVVSRSRNRFSIEYFHNGSIKEGWIDTSGASILISRLDNRK